LSNGVDNVVISLHIYIYMNLPVHTMKKNLFSTMIVVQMSVFVLLSGAYGVYRYIAGSKGEVAGVQDSKIFSNEQIGRYTSSRFASRAIFSFAQDVVKSSNTTGPEAARFYAYVATAFADVYEVSGNALVSIQLTGEMIKTLKPDTVDVVDKTISTLLQNQGTTVQSDEQNAYDKVKERLQQDGFENKWDGKLPSGNGLWQLPSGQMAQNPKAGSWKMWKFSIPEKDLAVEPPFSQKDSAYKREIELVERSVQDISPEQKSMVYFWDGGLGTESLSGIWQNRLYDEVSFEKTTERDYARMQRSLAQAIADGYTTTWAIKYRFTTARPNQVLSELQTVVPTPTSPGYVSEHGVISRLAAEILGVFVPEKSDVFLKDSQQARDSRLHAGVQFSMDDEQGYRLGKQLFEAVKKDI
jgi:hypothetical protein